MMMRAACYSLPSVHWFGSSSQEQTLGDSSWQQHQHWIGGGYLHLDCSASQYVMISDPNEVSLEPETSSYKLQLLVSFCPFQFKLDCLNTCSHIHNLVSNFGVCSVEILHVFSVTNKSGQIILFQRPSIRQKTFDKYFTKVVEDGCKPNYQH